MRLITKDTDYAIRALVVLAKRKEVVSASELVKQLKIPYPFLRQIMQELGKNKIVKSYKGRGGGFELRILPRNIYIIDLMKIFQGSLELTRCMVKNKICPDLKKCILRKKVKEIEKNIKSEFKNMTISDLVKEASNGKK
ncbi:MAG: Rrf2 family transcriptional regulator [Candidatus Omnitrophica bacterium]|nr:Rrf2 family transcriptional regulator [Candidatus Omnitrophota bacterium]